MTRHNADTPARYRNPSRHTSYVRHRMRERGEMPPLEMYSPEDAIRAAGLDPV